MSNNEKTTPSLTVDMADAKVAAMEKGETATDACVKTKSRKYVYTRRSNLSQVALRFLSMGSSIVAFSFMVTANESGFASFFGFQVPIHSNWSYSNAHEYLVAITVAVAAYSLLQFIIAGTRVLNKASLIPSRRQAWVIFFIDQAFAYGMLSAGSAAASVTNLNRLGIKHTALPNFCKPLKMFCDHVAVSVTFTFFGSFLVAASAIHHVVWLSKN
ncbi:hypothetical protein ACFE04_003779 [Oxalis oulophora]